MANLKRTPCVGVCSTTYGDLVCRGCKRFAHEIVQWNGFGESQRSLVWKRLFELRAGAVSACLKVVDPERLRQQALAVQVHDPDDLCELNLAFEVLRRCACSDTDLRRLGLRVSEEPLQAQISSEQVLANIEREFYDRSVAQYERNFHTVAH